MDIYPLRSPIYKVETAPSGAVSVKLELTIDSTLRYTIVKECTAGSTVAFEVAELARDYLQTPQLYNLATAYIYAKSTQVVINTTIKFYNAANAGGSQVGSTLSHTFNGVDGYSEWSEGANTQIPKGVSNAFLLEKLDGTNYEFFAPADYYLWISGTNSSDDVVNITNIYTGSSDSTYTYRSSTLNLKVVDCSRYTPTQVYFVNKYGGIQPLFFFTKKVDVINTRSENFQRNIIDTSTTTPSYFRPLVSGYPSYPHSIETYNKNGKKSYSLSSGYYPERANAYFEQLLLSEAVWIVTESVIPASKTIPSKVVPVVVKSSSFTYKTSLNDKLVEYTIDFEEAQDYINNVR